MKGNVIISILVIVFVLVLVSGSFYQKKLAKDQAEEAQKHIAIMKEKEKEQKKIEKFSDFYKMLYLNEVESIKLLGDSITAGVGTENFTYPQNAKEIYNDGNESFVEATSTSNSWANLFRNYINQKDYGVKNFTNAGIEGKSVKWALDNIDNLIDEQENVVFVMFGSDDRMTSTKEEYESNISKLLKIIDSRSNYMVVMSPPPAANDTFNNQLTSEDINEILSKISKKEKYTFISHFDGMNKYLENNSDVQYTDLMQNYGAYPSEKGYKVMWDTIKDELELQ